MGWASRANPRSKWTQDVWDAYKASTRPAALPVLPVPVSLWTRLWKAFRGLFSR